MRLYAAYVLGRYLAVLADALLTEEDDAGHAAYALVEDVAVHVPRRIGGAEEVDDVAVVACLALGRIRRVEHGAKHVGTRLGKLA